MNNDFSKPQRQSAFGIVIMAAHTLVKIGKPFIAPLILIFLKMKSEYTLYALLAIAAIVLISILFAYLWYLKFTFFLDQEKQEFVVNKGIFSRDQLTIQLSKIQQVNINQSILQKIIGVYGLKIDTAGSQGEEVSIRAINETAAYILKSHLLNGNQITTETIQLDEKQNALQKTPILKISSLTLLKVGITSNYGQSLALLVAFFYTVIYEGRQLLDAFQVDKNQFQSNLTSMLTIFTVAILAGTLLIVLLVINLIRTFYKYFELEISKHKQSLLLSAGLIAKKNALVDPNKVQIIRYSQNYFQRKMHFLNMSLKQAHFGKSKQGHQLHGATLEIPGCDASERDQLLALILGEIPQEECKFIPDWRFLNLPVFFRLVLPIAIFVITAMHVPELKPYLYLTPIYFVLGFAMIYISYTKHRLFVSKDFIVKKSGIWDISKEIVIPNKIQAITTFQYPWHKSVDVGHLCLHTAAGQIRFKYGNYSQIKKLVNYWLYQVESGDGEW